MFYSDVYHQAVDKTECSDSDDSEEVVTKKVKFSLYSKSPENSILENDQGSCKFDSKMDGKHDNNANGDRSVMLQIKQDEQLTKELQNQVILE